MQTGDRAIAATRPHETHGIRRAWIVALAVLAWWMALSATMLGQDAFKVLPINPDLDARPDPATGRVDSAKRLAYSERMRLVNDILSNSAQLNDNRAAFDQWFLEVIFPAMAQDSNPALADMATAREDFFASLERVSNPAAYDHLVKDLAFPTFRDIAADNYHPAVRLNAATVVGRLDARMGRGRDSTPEPLAEALPVLLSWFEDGANPEYLRIAALFGIERHASIDGQKTAGRWDDALRSRVQTALLPLLLPAPEGRSQEADYWMKRLALRALGGTREVGNNAEVAVAIRGMLSDVEQVLPIRIEAAIAYGKMRFANPADAQAKEVAFEVARLAVAAANDELTVLEETEEHMKLLGQFRTATPAGGTGTMGFAGSGPGGGVAPPGNGPAGASAGGASGSASAPPAGSAGGAVPGSGPGGSRGPGGSGPGGRGTGNSRPGAQGSGGTLGGTMGGMMGGMMGGQGVPANELPAYRYRLSQRRFMTVLYSLQMAMKSEGASPTGLETMGTSDPELQQISAALGKLMVAAQAGLSDREKELDLEKALSDFRANVKKEAEALERLLPTVAEDSGDPAASGDATDDPFTSGGN